MFFSPLSFPLKLQLKDGCSLPSAHPCSRTAFLACPSQIKPFWNEHVGRSLSVFSLQNWNWLGPHLCVRRTLEFPTPTTFLHPNASLGPPMCNVIFHPSFLSQNLPGRCWRSCISPLFSAPIKSPAGEQLIDPSAPSGLTPASKVVKVVTPHLLNSLWTCHPCSCTNSSKTREG